MAPEAAAAAASSVGSLMRTLAADRATQVYAGGPTIEDLVREEFRPLLKEWLDANLPPMVERLVRVEIETGRRAASVSLMAAAAHLAHDAASRGIRRGRGREQ